MKKRTAYLFMAFFILVLNEHGFATVDIPAINQFTKEYYIFDDNDYIGIGWKTYVESAGEIDFNRILAGGEYKQTFYPYKIEITIFVFIFLVIIVTIVKRCYRNRLL